MRVSDSHEPGRDEVEPRAERDQVEDAHELVDRRMVDVLLVSLVESVELGGDDPERNRQQQDAELRRNAGVPAVRRDHVREQERADEATDVGRQERASNEPSPAPDDCLTIGRVSADAAAFEQRRCALVANELV